MKAVVYDFKSYSLEQGLPQSQVFSLYQDKDHYVWVGTNGGGLSKFDGRNFLKYSSKQGLYGITVTAVEQVNENEYLVGTDVGLFKFDGERFLDHKGLGIEPFGAVQSLVTDKKGNVLVGSEYGMYFYSEGSFRLAAGTDSMMVNQITIGTNGDIYFLGSGKGLCSYRNGKVVSISEAVSLKDFSLLSIEQSSNGKLYAGSYDHLYEIDFLNKSYTIIPFMEFGSPINDLLFDKSDHLWIATDDGVYEYYLGETKSYTTKNGVLNNLVYALLEDHQGNIWFATDAGISIYTNSPFSMLISDDGFSTNYIWAMHGDEEKIWVGTEDGLHLVEDDEVEFQFFSNFRGMTILSIVKDSDGVLWVGTDSEGVFKIVDGNIEQVITKSYGISRGDFLMEDSNGDIWIISYSEGVLRVSDNEMKVFGSKEGLTSPMVIGAFEDNEGNIWVGTYNQGLFMLEGERFKKYTGLENELSIICFEKYKDGVFIATYGQGLYYIKLKGGIHSEIVELDKNGEMIEQGFLSLTFHEGDLWGGTNSGLYRINPDEILDGKSDAFTFYGKTDGFMGMECNQGSLVSFKDKLYIGTFKGLVVYDQKLLTDKVLPPEVMLSGPFLRNGMTLDSYNSELSHTNNELYFEFVGIDYAKPSSIEFSYMLEGYDNTWSTASKSNYIRYGNLPPGDYTFLVTARNNVSSWNPIPATFQFTIIPPFYQTIWFFILIGLIVLIGLVLFIKTREKMLVESKKKLEDLIGERTEELQFKNNQLEDAKSQIETKNKEITDSIKYAQKIQMAVMSDQQRFLIDVPNSFVILKPRDLVSGDFFWYSMSDDCVTIACCDSTGHGVPGGFMSMMGNDFLNQIVKTNPGIRPNEILKQLNNNVNKALKRSTGFGEGADGMDASICNINLTSKKLYMSSALRPVFILRGNELIVLKGDKLPIGGIAPYDTEYSIQEFDLNEGDWVIQFTDGFVDQFGGPDGKKIKTKKFKELLLELKVTEASEFSYKLESSFEFWKGDLEQVDDVLVVGIRVGSQ